MSEPETRTCPSCGEVSPRIARFCMHCGTSFARPESAASGTASHVPAHPDRAAQQTAQAQQAAQSGGLLVGRESELAALLQLGAALSAGIGRVALVLGEPGMGKSRLVAEWKAASREDTRSSLHWATARCLEHSRSRAYHLLADMLRALLGQATTIDESELHTALHTRCAELFGADDLEMFPYLGHLLGLPLEGAALSQVQGLDAQTLRTQYRNAMRALLSALAEQTPLVVVLEDVHWADPSSVDLLIKLLPLATELPLLFCILSRFDHDAPGWDLVNAAREVMGSALTELPLRPLSSGEGQHLITSLPGANELSHAMHERILTRAEGNPFFIEEVVQMLINQGVLVHRDGRWTATGSVKHITIPDTVQELLRTRMEQLPAAARQVARVAAVTGRQFPLRVLEQVMEDPLPTAASLTALETSGLLRLATTHPELEYRFRHALIQEAAYASLLEHDRTRLHLAVGEALEELYPHRQAQLASQLALHFAAAGMRERATRYAILAGDEALAAYANQEAESHYRLAVSLCDTLRERARAAAGLGQALARQSRYVEAIEDWRSSIAYYRQLNDDDTVARLYAAAARAAWYQDDRRTALKLCHEGLAAVAHAPESAGFASLLHETGRAYHFLQLPEQANSYTQQALKMAERLGAVDVEAEALTTLAILDTLPNEEIKALLLKAIEIAGQAGLVATVSRAHHNLGVVLAWRLGDLTQARQHTLRAIDLERRQGTVTEEFISYTILFEQDVLRGAFADAESTLADIRQLMPAVARPDHATLVVQLQEVELLRLRGLWVVASERLDTLEADIRRSGDDELFIQFATYVADSRIEQGVMETAVDILEEVIDRMNSGDGGGEAAHKDRPYFLLALARANRGQFAEAQQLLATPRAMPGGRGVFMQAMCTTTAARIAVAAQQWEEALTGFAEAAATMKQMGARWWYAWLALEAAAVYQQRGSPTDMEAARDLLSEALSIFEHIDAPGYVERTRERLARVRAQLHLQAVSHQQTTHELQMAAAIQTGLLPDELPHVPGWQLAALMLPARETAGDFYDCIRLPDGNLGIVIADVAEKGVGAALYMALGRTLIRTYAAAYPTQPEKVLAATNERLFSDTPTDLFISAFYGVLNPHTGTLVYCNAGHNPPYVLDPEQPGEVRALLPTGMLLGVSATENWWQASMQLVPGALLLLYTDGVVEAENDKRDFFESGRLLSAIQECAGQTAHSAHDTILARVEHFVAGAPRHDDLTIMVVTRDTA